jgi:hypothetical protein
MFERRGKEINFLFVLIGAFSQGIVYHIRMMMMMMIPSMRTGKARQGEKFLISQSKRISKKFFRPIFSHMGIQRKAFYSPVISDLFTRVCKVK